MMGIQLVALSVVAALSPPQDLKAPVSLHTYGTSVAAIVRQLKEATHADLRVTDQLGKEVVLVDVDKVPADELMKRIAEVMHAEWAKSDQVYQLLVRDTEIRKAVNARIARETVLIKKAVDDQMDRLKRASPAGVAQTQVQLTRFAAGSDLKAVVQVAALISPATMAAVAPGARVVFTSTPFGVQVPLPGATQAVIREALAERLKATQPPANAANRGPNQVANRVYESLRTGTYAKAYFVVQRQGWTPILSVSLSVVNNAGDQLVTGSTVLFAAPAMSSAAGSDKERIELSDEAKQLVGKSVAGSKPNISSNFTFDGGRVTRISDVENPSVAPAVADLMRDPVARDPLSFFVGEAVRGVSPSDKPVVALLSDELFEGLRPMFAGGSSPTSAVSDLLKRLGYTLEVKDGWATAAPEDIDRCLRHRLDRRAFKAVVTSSAALGVAPLDTMASYAQASPDLDGSSWDTYYAAALAGQSLASQVVDARGTNREAYLVYAAVPVGQRNQPRVAVSANAARNPLGDLVFRSVDGPQPTGRGRGQQVNQSRAIMFFTGENGSPIEVQMNQLGGFERTDVFSSVPPQTQVQLLSNAESVLRVVDPQSGKTQVLSPSELAMTRAMSEQRGGAVDKPSADTKYQIVTRRRVQVLVDFSGQYAMNRSLTDYALVTGNVPVAFEALPAEAQQQYQVMYDRMSQAFANGRGERLTTGRRRGEPPPQP